MHCANWKDLKPKKKVKIESEIQKSAQKFWKEVSSLKKHLPYFKTRFMFFVCKQLQKRSDGIDHEYWKAQGWLDGTSPFKKS